VKIVLNGTVLARVVVKNGKILNPTVKRPRQVYSKGWGEQYSRGRSNVTSLQEEQEVKKALAAINRTIGAGALTSATSKIVSGRRLETIRKGLEDGINETLREIQPAIAEAILGQASGSLKGQMGGYLPGYAALSPPYLAKKLAIASGRRRLKTKNVNYLRRNPALATKFFVYGGDLVRSLTRTANTFSRRAGRAKVTFNAKVNSKTDVLSKTRTRGARVGSDFEREEYNRRIGSFKIEYFGRLSFHELNQMYNYKPGTSGVRDDALPYTLFNKPIAARLKGNNKGPARPLLLPTMAFYAQKRIPQVIKQYLEGRAQTILYDRKNPRSPRP
jgi:hypothetical protein